MTAEQVDEHDALNMPIAQILGRVKRRPLTQPEFLRLMSLLTTQRIIANGLAQLRFEQIWPDLSRIERPTDSTLRGLASPKTVGVPRADRPARPGRRAQSGRVQPVAADAPACALGDARSARARGRQTGILHRRGGPEAAHAETSWTSTTTPPAACSSRPMPAVVGLNLQRAASACINIELPWEPGRCSSSESAGFTASGSAGRLTSTTW